MSLINSLQRNNKNCSSPCFTHGYVDLFWMLALVASTLLVFWPVTSHEFLPYDDPGYVALNPWVRQGLNPATFIEAFTTYHQGNWHPLTTLSHLADISLFGLDAHSHHSVNLAWHTATVILFYFLLRQIKLAPLQSGLLGLLFAIHPVHVESVAWLSARKDVLSGFFWMACLIAYVGWTRQRENGQRGWTLYGIQLCFGTLALMGKPTTITLPFALLLMDIWPLGRFQREDGKTSWRRVATLVMEKFPYYPMVVFLAWITVQAQEFGGAVASADIISFSERVYLSFYAYLAYLKLFLAPVQLSYLHELRLPVSWSMGIPGLFAVTGISYGIWRIRKNEKCPMLAVGWIFFLGVMIPMIGIIKVGLHSHAERYMYLPMIGLLWMLLPLIPQRLGLEPARWVILSIICLWITWLGIIAHEYTHDWKNMPGLHRRAIATQPGHCMATAGRAGNLVTSGDYTKAIDDIRHVIDKCKEVAPQEQVYAHLSRLYANQGRHQEAMDAVRNGLKIMPDSIVLNLQLGKTLLDMQRYDEAIEILSKADSGTFGDFNRLHWLGQAYLNSPTHKAQALKHFTDWSRNNPSDPGIWYYLGIAWEQNGNPEAAQQAYQQSLNVAADSIPTRLRLGQVLMGRQKFAQAREQFLQILTMKPDHAEARAMLQHLPPEFQP